MTERFKKAVKAYVKDGTLSSDEEKDLLIIAKEEEISESDAIIYMKSELKDIISRKQFRKEVIDIAKDVASIIGTVAGVALTIIATKKK